MISVEQKRARRMYLGSSDAPAILGVSPYRTASQVWLEKTGKVELEFEGNEATTAGTALEPMLLDYAENEIGQEIVRDKMVVHENELLCANLDGISADGLMLVEAKTSGIFGPANESYGEPETDEVPESVVIQVAHQFLMVPTAKVCLVPVLIGGRGIKKYILHRNDELCAEVLAQGVDFMENYVRTNIQPPDFVMPLEMAKRIYRTPGTVAKIPQALFDEYIALYAAAEQAKFDSDLAKAKLLMALGDAEGGIVGPRVAFTYYKQHRKSYRVKESDYRVLRMVKEKK